VYLQILDLNGVDHEIDAAAVDASADAEVPVGTRRNSFWIPAYAGMIGIVGYLFRGFARRVGAAAIGLSGHGCLG
jgi:hypothetical protein